MKLSTLVAAALVVGKDKANMLSRISLSKDTVKRRINELSQDIKDQLLDKKKQFPFFAIQCCKTTDIGNCFQFLLYARFSSVKTIKEEMLFCLTVKILAIKADIFNVLSNFFQKNQLSWES